MRLSQAPDFMKNSSKATRRYQVIKEDVNLDTHEHLPFLNEVAKGNVLEIGVHCGMSTTALLAGVEEKGGHLWSIDTHPACRYIWYGHPQWTFYCTWSGDKPQPDLPLDVVFIDGDHSYNFVMDDLEGWVPKVKPGGLVLLHDVDCSQYGVRRAVDDYCSVYKLEHETRHGSNGLEVIYTK